MADQWFYAHGEDRSGPYSGQQLKDLAASGAVLPTDTVWKEGIEKGALASRVRYLFAPGVLPIVVPVVAIIPVPDVVAALAESIPLPLPVPTVPAEVAKVPVQPPIPQPRERRGTAVAVRGAIIVGQDGLTVKFKKKCTTCGFLDSSWQTIPIRNGATRSNFFCLKCRKSREVEIKGSLS